MSKQTLKKADHLKVWRVGFWHHGLYLGNGRVVHYSGELFSRKDACICIVSLEEFADGAKIKVVPYASCDSPEVVIARAKNRLGEKLYGVVLNNCEHFVYECKTGKKRSEQVERFARSVTNQVSQNLLREGAKRAGGEVIRNLGRTTLRGNAMTSVAMGLVEQSVDTVRWFNGTLDDEAYKRNSIANGLGTGGALGGAAIGSLFCPVVGTIVGGFIGGMVGGITGQQICDY